jgi:hypothetical protein
VAGGLVGALLGLWLFVRPAHDIRSHDASDGAGGTEGASGSELGMGGGRGSGGGPTAATTVLTPAG